MQKLFNTYSTSVNRLVGWIGIEILECPTIDGEGSVTGEGNSFMDRPPALHTKGWSHIGESRGITGSF